MYATKAQVALALNDAVLRYAHACSHAESELSLLHRSKHLNELASLVRDPKRDIDMLLTSGLNMAIYHLQEVGLDTHHMMSMCTKEPTAYGIVQCDDALGATMAQLVEVPFVLDVVSPTNFLDLIVCGIYLQQGRVARVCPRQGAARFAHALLPLHEHPSFFTVFTPDRVGLMFELCEISAPRTLDNWRMVKRVLDHKTSEIPPHCSGVTGAEHLGEVDVLATDGDLALVLGVNGSVARLVHVDRLISPLWQELDAFIRRIEAQKKALEGKPRGTGKPRESKVVTAIDAQKFL